MIVPISITDCAPFSVVIYFNDSLVLAAGIRAVGVTYSQIVLTCMRVYVNVSSDVVKTKISVEQKRIRQL